MINYYINEAKNSVIAILPNTSNDAHKYIEKTGIHSALINDTRVVSAAKMPNEFRVEVVCEAGDIFDPSFGKARARKIVLDNYFASKEKAIRRAYDEIDKIVITANLPRAEIKINN